MYQNIEISSVVAQLGETSHKLLLEKYAMMSQDSEGTPRNPLNLDEHLKVTVSDSPTVPPAHTLLADEHDSAVTKAEKFESSGLAESHHGQEPPPSKRVKLDLDPPFSETTAIPVERVKGIAPIKAEHVDQCCIFHPLSNRTAGF